MTAELVSLPRAKDPIEVKPIVEQAIKLYALGKFTTQVEAAAYASMHPNRFNTILQSPAGQAILNEVRKELDFRFDSLFKKTIDVIDMALDHPEPSVALAGASLFLKTNKGTKVNVELSAEDVVQQIMSGTYLKEA